MLANNEYWLEPQYDSRNSFYRKAKVVTEGNIKKLYSYGTLVAEIDWSKTGDERALIHGFYSQTTTRHIKDFLYQEGFSVGSSNDLWLRYTPDGRVLAAEKARKAEEREQRRIEREKLAEEKAIRKAEREKKRYEKLFDKFKKEFGDSFDDDYIDAMVQNELA